MTESGPDAALDFGSSFDSGYGGEDGGGSFRLAPIMTEEDEGSSSDAAPIDEPPSALPSFRKNSYYPRRISSGSSQNCGQSCGQSSGGCIGVTSGSSGSGPSSNDEEEGDGPEVKGIHTRAQIFFSSHFS
jgi:hypothetical protein